MFAAVTVVLVLIGIYVPLLGLVSIFFSPVPITLLYLRHNRRTALLASIVAILVLILFTGPLSGFLQGAMVGMIGMTLGWGFKRDLPAWANVLAATIASAAWLAISMLLPYLIFRENPFELMERFFSQAFEAVSKMSQVQGSAQKNPLMALEQLKSNLRLLFPALLASGSAITGFLSFLAAQLVLRRMGHNVKPVPAFTEWRLPKPLFYVFLANMVLAVLTDKVDVPLVKPILLNLNMVLYWVFLVQGLSFAVYFLNRWNVARGLSVVLVAGLLLFFPMVVVTAGLFDTVTDYRRLSAKADKGVDHREGDT